MKYLQMIVGYIILFATIYFATEKTEINGNKMVLFDYFETNFIFGFLILATMMVIGMILAGISYKNKDESK